MERRRACSAGSTASVGRSAATPKAHVGLVVTGQDSPPASVALRIVMNARVSAGIRHMAVLWAPQCAHGHIIPPVSPRGFPGPCHLEQLASAKLDHLSDPCNPVGGTNSRSPRECSSGRDRPGDARRCDQRVERSRLRRVDRSSSLDLWLDPLCAPFHGSHAFLGGTGRTALRRMRRFIWSPVCGTNLALIGPIWTLIAVRSRERRGHWVQLPPRLTQAERSAERGHHRRDEFRASLRSDQ